MSITASALRELHRLHRQLSDLRSRLDRGPKLVAAGDLGVSQFEESLAEVKQKLTKARVAADDKQLQLKQREDRVADLNAKLNGCSNNREYQAFKDQISADNQANSVLADEIFESLERIDEIEAEVKTSEQNLAKATVERNRTKHDVEEKHQVLSAEVERITAELSEAEKGLQGDFRSEYDRMTEARGENALAEIDGQCCSGCYQKITAQTMNELILSKPVFCKSCGCLLYLPEDFQLRGDD